jgi:hypothetical protein
VGEVLGDAGGVDDIVEGKLVNEGRKLEQERERLANATRCASNNSLDHFDGVFGGCGLELKRSCVVRVSMLERESALCGGQI